MKAKYIGLLFLTMVTGLTSCNDYLNIDPTDKTSDKLIWSSIDYAEMAINYFYSDIPYLGSYSDYQCLAGMTEGLTDEFKYSDMTYNSLMYIPNEISYGGSTLTVGYVDTYLGEWGGTYEEIRRVNEALNKLASSSFDATTKTRFEAELRFFRGMYYFELLKRYHQAILYDADLSQISTNKALSPETDCWKFVYDDLKFAGENLTVSKSPTGRLTSGAAYALMSRAMLYCQNWTAVKEASEKIFTMGYSLTDNYADAFKSDNSEDIFQYSYSSSDDVSHSFDTYYAPGGDKAIDGNNASGGYATPTQDMVEEYEYSGESGKTGKPDWSAWHSTTGTNDTPPYAELEPRFAATILYNGATWKEREIEPYIGGTDGWCTWKTDAQPAGRTTTGYYLRKLVDESHHFSKVQASTQPYIAFRLAEVYLNYAEACYRSGDATTALTYINKVRSRVNLAGWKNLTGDNLFAALRHERKVELAYEGLYYWDMRRWGLSTTAFTGIKRHGLKIEKNANGSFTYTYVTIDDQNLNYPTKLNRFPIPQTELNNNKDIEQFSEWK
jgi:hypothetical protein